MRAEERQQLLPPRPANPMGHASGRPNDVRMWEMRDTAYFLYFSPLTTRLFSPCSGANPRSLTPQSPAGDAPFSALSASSKSRLPVKQSVNLLLLSELSNNQLVFQEEPGFLQPALWTTEHPLPDMRLPEMQWILNRVTATGGARKLILSTNWRWEGASLPMHPFIKHVNPKRCLYTVLLQQLPCSRLPAPPACTVPYDCPVPWQSILCLCPWGLARIRH